MSKIRIRNFGPIKEGYQEDDGWFDLKKISVFIGNQGSGKSTIAKLFSSMTWIEKALVRGDFNEKDLSTHRFKKHCSYQNIQNYFKENSLIEFKGKAYSISYKEGIVNVNKNKNDGYLFPKIMYIPSERNFISTVKNVRNLKGLPNTLYTFSDEYIDAIETLEGRLELPINNAKFEYQKLSKMSSIIGEDYKINLSEASSGFQSIVPLYIVTRYLALSLNKEPNSTVKEISIEEGKRIREEIEKIYSNPKLSEEVRKASLEHLSSRFKHSCFINIVEEPEQNLFPSSQRIILNKLLEYTNLNKGNELLLTTHSPYIINYLTLCVKAKSVYAKLEIEKSNLGDSELVQANEIVPISAAIDSNNLVIYELNEIDGSIKKLPDYNGLPSDENKLNYVLEDSNELFAQLQEIEKGWR